MNEYYVKATFGKFDVGGFTGADNEWMAAITFVQCASTEFQIPTKNIKVVKVERRYGV